MSIVELSGVLGNKDLKLNLVPGPSPSDANDRGVYLWPELNPGFFRAGEFTIHSGIDYLFAREARITFQPVTGLAVSDREIPRLHGPVLAAFFPTSGTVSGATIGLAEASTGWISRNESWKELICAPCRKRIYRSLADEGTWTLDSTLSDSSRIFKLKPNDETDGYGPIYDPILIELRDTETAWNLIGTEEDLIEAGTPGTKQWARSVSGEFIIRCAPGESPPSNLAGSWIASQVTLDWEELAVSTLAGVPLSVGTKEEITDVYVQYVEGSFTATGAVVSGYTEFPRLAIVPGLDTNKKVVVRYKPSGVYLLAEGTSGAVVGVRVPETSIVCVRYEESSPEEKFAGGRLIRNGVSENIAVSPLISPAGFFLGIAPGHPMHSISPGAGQTYGEAPKNSRVLAWATPSILFPSSSPCKLRVMVIGGDGIPIPGVEVEVSVGPFLYTSSSTITTDREGQAFAEITRQAVADGVSPVTVSIYNDAILVDSQTIDIYLGTEPDEEIWTRKILTGKVHLAILADRAKSGVSRRRQLAIWRTQLDGIPSSFSDSELTLSTTEGRLFATYGSKVTVLPEGGGREISITLNKSGNNDWFDYPVIVEYEPSETGERDVIRAKWSSPTVANGAVVLDEAYGTLVIGDI